MNWEIIIGGLLIFGGIAQFFRLLNEYQYKNSIAVSIGLAFVFIAIVITGISLVRQGRKQARSKF